MERQLVTYRTVKELKPIDGADKIELAIVDGWQCVVDKGAFVSGDIGIFFEIDSFLPIRPEFEFLRKSSYKKMGDEEGFRLRTIRMRGQISQGLFVTLSMFPELIGAETPEQLQETLKVQKYDPPLPACLGGDAVGYVPGFICKTDQERVQNLVDFVASHAGVLFEATEKLDGSSCTYYHNNGAVGVCSRNLELKRTEGNTFWRIADELSVFDILTSLGRNIAIQGEVCGPGIQKNRYRLKKQVFFVFDIWDIDQQRYLTPVERTDLMCEFDGFDHVPILKVVTLPGTVDEILAVADGRSQLTATPREGMVFKAMEVEGGRVPSFKAISNAFLEKEG